MAKTVSKNKKQVKNKFSKLFKEVNNLYAKELMKITHATHHDPFSVLGNQAQHSNKYLIFYYPNASKLQINQKDKRKNPLECTRFQETDFFICDQQLDQLDPHYELGIIFSHNHEQLIELHDPYSFGPQISEYDLHLFSEGKHQQCYKFLGAHHKIIDGISGVLFSTWAPNAQRVSIIGDFNGWDGRRHPMRTRYDSGIWELFIPGIHSGDIYKFEIRNHHTGEVVTKSDPYAQQTELRPKTASIIKSNDDFIWHDNDWLQKRQNSDWLHEPLSIYECHLGSWQRNQNNQFLDYHELAHQLVPYVKSLGFTHIELLPITEHPLDASWGYQTTGYFSPTRRFGTADEFRYFVNFCHEQDIGVLLDWVPAHFPKDSHGLARFDGSALYEHEDPRKGEHKDWGTLIYNYGRNEVRNFLIGSACFWLDEYHLDGLRVDAVASMLYLDYSREEGEWVANEHGGNENTEAVHFLQELNKVTHAEYAGTIIMAEESTSWPQVTRPVDQGGLGFSMKWNMGWMHDTLTYMSRDPIYRTHHHNQLTFGLLYAFTENFALPLSHDEVVHGKGSLLNKMPGDDWQRFANLRLLYTYMFSYPGKKLLFMGAEIAQGSEWNQDQALDWYILQYPHHQGIKSLVTDLNHLYKEKQALYYYDFHSKGFEWISCDDQQQSIIAYKRIYHGQEIITILNFTPIVRKNYKINLNQKAQYNIIFNSDSAYYAGSDSGSHGHIKTKNDLINQNLIFIELDLPPLAGLMLEKV
ncbi:MAG: 1,4-alpha-glucan branching protein GlgB [Gammaproteobacteria bacterium]|nr:1,4-alpha-glucan branching protein GlgB [Gammaproteobacteria bacterium]